MLAENDALRDVAAGKCVSFAHQSGLSVSAREATTSGVDNATSQTGRHRWTGLFHPQKADHYAKTTGRNPEVY